MIDLDTRTDERGFFARLFCAEEFAAHGLAPQFVQANNSFCTERGTLRGLHYQLPPMEEDKLIRCLSGALWDLVLDLRPYSTTYRQWFGATLSAENRTMMYVPKGCAHGFLSLAPHTEMLYLVSQRYAPNLERGVRWDDPAFQIQWPFAPTTISDKDRHYPYFEVFPHAHSLHRS